MATLKQGKLNSGWLVAFQTCLRTDLIFILRATNKPFSSLKTKRQPVLSRNIGPLIVATLLLMGCHTTRPVSQENTIEKSVSKPQFAFDFADSEQLMPLLDQAKAERKLVFVDFYTDWCLPCRLMEKDVFMDQELGAFFNENFINYKVDAEKGNGVNLAQIFSVKAYPTLLFLNDKGQVLERKEGAAYHTELKAMAESAISKR